MPVESRDPRLLAVLAVVALASLAYSLLIAQQILLWVYVVAVLGTLYLFWRLIRALERIARAMERDERER